MLCDLGSQVNMVTGNTAQRLKLNRTATTTEINGINGITNSAAIVEFEISPSCNRAATETTQAYVVRKIIGKMPQEPINTKEWPSLRRLQLADKAFNDPADIDMLVGAEFYSRLIRNGILKTPNGPTAQNTSFGWIIFGEHNTHEHDIKMVSCAAIDGEEIMRHLQHFWQLEQTEEKKHRGVRIALAMQ